MRRNPRPRLPHPPPRPRQQHRHRGSRRGGRLMCRPPRCRRRRAHTAPGTISTKAAGSCCRKPGKPWRVRISDLDTGNILYETEIAAGRVSSTKQYFVRHRLELWQAGESVMAHEYSAEGREVLIQFPVGTLGDTMGWFPYAVKFL